MDRARDVQFICRLVVQYTDQSINPLACAECGDSLPFSGASSIPLCHTLFPATPLHRPFFHPPSLHPAICFLVCLLVLFPNSYTILFWEIYFLPFSVHVQTIVIYAALIHIIFFINLCVISGVMPQNHVKTFLGICHTHLSCNCVFPSHWICHTHY